MSSLVYLLSGDIGGTNSRFQLFRLNRNDSALLLPVRSGQRALGELILSKQFSNSGYKTFLDVIIAFLDQANVGEPPISACFAVAGPVNENSVLLTNRNWMIDGASLQTKLGISRVLLVNDFVALGYGLLTLEENKECVALHKAIKVSGGPIACIGAGTGLGECYLTSTASATATATATLGKAPAAAVSYEYQCLPSEGGHAEFSPRNDVEYGLLKYLKKKYSGEGSQNRVSLERVVAGSGLPDVYEYLSITFPERVDKSIHDAISKAGDLKAAVIANYKNSNELCRRTMDIFLTHYGSEAGVACLKWVPTGGLYITGGLTPKNIDEIRNQNGLFMQALLDKGRVKAMVAKCPVWAVLVEDLGERGAHFVAFKELQQEFLKAAASGAASGAGAGGASSSAESNGNGGSNAVVKYGLAFAAALLVTSFFVGATAQNGPNKLKLPWSS